ncbi:hypothetical protein [Cupriavidus campinensis]|jgi:hypothetical protein|uniref:Uncharacterized protein n=1 Tax=Cupriavidus campinensis TaxID=151783 RepID=A0AAE9L3F8_9BURK|nr:hypothetical protein [Cupriavidus campinensis]URF05040.1 hypothetical protein M5D45_04165 [Cupriavidus campinensis]
MMSAADQRREVAQQKRRLSESQQEILAALKKAWPGFYAKVSKVEVGSGDCHKLSHLQIGMGVRALALACNLRGGSTGDMDLYQLLRAYFWDQDARQRINEIVETSLAPNHSQR